MNELRHYYLYAKGWYKKTELIEDLKIIHANWCGIDTDHITINDITSKLAELAYDHIDSSYDFTTFISHSGFYTIGSHNLNIIKASLSTLYCTSSKDIPFKLGLPNFKLLSKMD